MPLPGVCQNILKDRKKLEVQGTLTDPKKFLDQDYEFLLQYHLAGNWRFSDDLFPSESSSIGANLLSYKDMANVEWIRPTRLVSNPHLFVDGVSRFDFNQGQLGNCWFLAAVGALTFQKHIMKMIIPDGQSFHKNYAGIFHFRFWRFGKWVDVVIDDKLPTINGQLIFAKSIINPSPSAPNEFWPALLEKAYAKVCGSYADMKGGWVSEALMDFTGGVYVTINPKIDGFKRVWEVIHLAATANSMMGCGTPGQSDVNSVLPNGLVEGHAYTVTAAAKVMSYGKEVYLIRLFNPWGHEEWRGDWSDKSNMWNTVRDEDQKLRRVFEDGEFWMSLEDFCNCFCQLDICSTSPSFLDGTTDKWNCNSFEGRWVIGSTAGGCMDNKDSFWINPKFQVTVESCGQPCGPNVLIYLMQKPYKRNRRLIRKLYIGFSIFQLPANMETLGNSLSASFFNSLKLVDHTKTLYDSREVMNFSTLKPGEYLIVPYTHQPNQTASFLLQVWSKNRTHTEEAFNMRFSQMQIKSDENQKVILDRQMSNQYKEINAEQLQGILHWKLGISRVENEQNSRGFGIDACQSIIAMMDLSVTGTLNTEELSTLLNKVEFFKELFFYVDKNRDAILSLGELRNAVEGAGFHVDDGLLKLLAMRFGDSTGRITLERFICLALRLRCMSKIFKKLGDGHKMHLAEHEWLHLTMYS